MMNGENLQMIKRNLDENSIEYIQNAYPVIQRSLNNGDSEFADIVTRDVSRLGEIARPKPSETSSMNISVFGDWEIPLNAHIEKTVSPPPQEEPQQPIAESEIALRKILEKKNSEP